MALVGIVFEPSSLFLCVSAAITIYYGAARAVEYERSCENECDDNTDSGQVRDSAHE